MVHDRFLEQEQREKKRQGKPCDDCISCQAGIEGSDFDKQGVIYLLTCRICSEEYVGESQRAIRTRLSEHHADARRRSNETTRTVVAAFVGPLTSISIFLERILNHLVKFVPSYLEKTAAAIR